MKKVLTIMAVFAVVAVASADLAYFQINGGKLFDQGDVLVPAGTITDGTVILLGDLSLDVSGGQINIADIPVAWMVADLAVKQPFLGGNYGTLALTERPSAAVGQTASFVADINGGGIQVGDFISIYAFVVEDMAAVGSPAPATPQFVTPGDLTAGVEVIPEPATFGLMGVAALGLFLARKKARR